MNPLSSSLRAYTAFFRSAFALSVATLIWFLSKELFVWQTRLLVGGLVYTCTALSLVWYIIGWSDARRTAQQEDESRPLIFLLTIAGAFVSVFAVVALLGSIQGLSPNETTRHAALSVATVLSSWSLIHSMFTLHYAHLYYKPGHANSTGGLAFPGDDIPDYLDFAYFSFVIGMTCQVSDVAISGRSIRRLTLAHSVLSFAFNTVIIAFSINTLSGFL